MRNVSPEIQTVIASKGYSSYWLADIHLPAQGDLLPAADFYVSDSAVFANGHSYQPLLRVQKPRMIQTLGKAPDGGSITVDNITGEIGQAVVRRGRNFEGAKFTLWKAFLIGLNQLGLDKWMEGEIRAASITESDQTITFQLNSDLLKRQSLMGAWMLSQRCIVQFNKGGGNPTPATARCGWREVQGGSPDSCDKTEDGENGCNAHGNLHRIAAVPAVAASTNIATTPGGGGGGFDGGDGDGHCFLAGTPILLPGGGSMPIEEIVAGQEVLAPVYDKKTGEDLMTACAVEAVLVNTKNEWLEVRLPHGILQVTSKHRFYTGSGTFRTIGQLEAGETVRVVSGGVFRDSEILEKILRTGEARVYNLSVKTAHTYFANLVAVHNAKPL